MKELMNTEVANSIMASLDPSNFEGDGVHPNLLKKPKFLESSSFVIHITYYKKKVANFLNFVP